jgi:hypothetical protein
VQSTLNNTVLSYIFHLLQRFQFLKNQKLKIGQNGDLAEADPLGGLHQLHIYKGNLKRGKMRL